MNLIEKAFQQLYPEKTLDYNTKLIYSGRFKPYNANASRSITTLTIKLSKKWKSIDTDSGIDVAREIRSRHIIDFSNWKDTKTFDISMKKPLSIDRFR